MLARLRAMGASKRFLRRITTALATVAALACASSEPLAPPQAGPPGPGCAGEVWIYEMSRSRKGASLGIESRCFVPLTLEVTFHSLLNIEPDRPRPIRLYLEPGQSEAPFVHLNATRRASWSYGTIYHAVPGRSPAVHDDAVRYAVPFGGAEQRECVQGPREKPTHLGSHAFDFAMPIGTPIVASRAGVVYATVDGFDQGSAESAKFLERSNHVVVLHDDGTTAAYAHLQRGVVVREGDRVAVGQLLGHSGNSGYSSGPHLHFEVGIPEMTYTQTIPIVFVGEPTACRGHSFPATPVREPSTAGSAATTPSSTR
jgi:murein DD-endopeptidase MepM/ murein hydrolase activator NlpD